MTEVPVLFLLILNFGLREDFTVSSTLVEEISAFLQIFLRGEVKELELSDATLLLSSVILKNSRRGPGHARD